MFTVNGSENVNEAAPLLRKLINEEERIIVCNFKDDKRIALFELVRAIDFYFVSSLSLNDEKKFNEWNESEEKHFIEFGINTALSLFIGEHCYQPGVLLGPSKREIQNWASSVIQRCDRIGMCKMIPNRACRNIRG